MFRCEYYLFCINFKFKFKNRESFIRSSILFNFFNTSCFELFERKKSLMRNFTPSHHPVFEYLFTQSNYFIIFSRLGVNIAIAEFVLILL